MAPDPHQGGRLGDMAAEGTTIPGDAGKMNLVRPISTQTLLTYFSGKRIAFSMV